MSISRNDNNIKIWNVNNWECIQNFTNVNKDGWLLSACFLEENNQIYIITSNRKKRGNSENIKNKIKLIESSCDGNIRIWNFHSSELLDKIKADENWVTGICLWNNDYVLAGCNDKKIKIIDLNKKKIIKDLNGHNNDVLTLTKINHLRYGECLISQGYKDDGIRIWINILDN